MAGEAVRHGRPNHLESDAHRMWAMYGHEMQEVVGLGFEDPIDGTITWYTLRNSHVGPGEFTVSDADVRHVLEIAARTGYHDPAARRILWHSHTNTAEPSETDIMEFPEWVDEARIYHAPTAGTVAYKADGDHWSLTNESGAIFRNSSDFNIRNATSEDSDAR